MKNDLVAEVPKNSGQHIVSCQAGGDYPCNCTSRRLLHRRVEERAVTDEAILATIYSYCVAAAEDSENRARDAAFSDEEVEHRIRAMVYRDVCRYIDEMKNEQ